MSVLFGRRLSPLQRPGPLTLRAIPNSSAPSVHSSRHPMVVFSSARHHVGEAEVKSASQADERSPRPHTRIVRNIAGDAYGPFIAKPKESL